MQADSLAAQDGETPCRATSGSRSEQDRIHLPDKLIDSPNAVAFYDFTRRVEEQAVELAKSEDLFPVLADRAFGFLRVVLLVGYLSLVPQLLGRSLCSGRVEPGQRRGAD